MDSTIHQQTQKALTLLPPEGLEELAKYIEFLLFKYKPIQPSEPSTAEPISSSVSPDSLTARFQGFVQSPLKVAELSAAYEFNLMGDDE
jgi:hypothetical protein